MAKKKVNTFKVEGQFEGKQKPMDLNIFFQNSGSRKSITNAEIPTAISSSLTPDGWYIYSHDDTAPKTKSLSSNVLYLDTAPLKGLKTYLSSYHFPGVGPKAVDKLYETFGMDIISYLLKGKLPKIIQAVVSKKVIQSLESGWQNSRDYAISYIFLDELGFKTSQKRFVREQFGASFIIRLNKFPFETLQRIPRLAFSDMAGILRRVNIEVSDDQIILAASSFRLLQSERSFGNTCAPVNALVSGVSKLTSFSNEKINKTLEEYHSRFDWFEAGSSRFIQSQSSKDRDKTIGTELQRIKDEFQRAGSNKKFMRSELKTLDDIELSDEQIIAVNKSVNEPVSVITGGPGAGKTTILHKLKYGKVIETEISGCRAVCQCCKDTYGYSMAQCFSA